jgi:hypothetical protein
MEDFYEYDGKSHIYKIDEEGFHSGFCGVYNEHHEKIIEIIQAHINDVLKLPKLKESRIFPAVNHIDYMNKFIAEEKHKKTKYEETCADLERLQEYARKIGV